MEKKLNTLIEDDDDWRPKLNDSACLDQEMLLAPDS